MKIAELEGGAIVEYKDKKKTKDAPKRRVATDEEMAEFLLRVENAKKNKGNKGTNVTNYSKEQLRDFLLKN